MPFPFYQRSDFGRIDALAVISVDVIAEIHTDVLVAAWNGHDYMAMLLTVRTTML